MSGRQGFPPVAYVQGKFEACPPRCHPGSGAVADEALSRIVITSLRNLVGYTKVVSAWPQILQQIALLVWSSSKRYRQSGYRCS